MKIFSNPIIILFLINMISSFPFCPESKEPPEEITKDSTKKISPIIFKEKEYLTAQTGSNIFLNKNTLESIGLATSGYYDDREYCPENFKIPTKSDYESIISELGSNAYSIFTKADGLNMTKGNYYLTNTKGSNHEYSKLFLYLDENSLQFIDKHPFHIKGKIRCLLSLKEFKYTTSANNKDLDLNVKSVIKNNFSKYFLGYIWKIDEKIFKTETVEYSFSKSGGHLVEFWGKYSDNLKFYFCDFIYVNKKKV